MFTECDRTRPGVGRRRFLYRGGGLLAALVALPSLTACGPPRPLRIMLHDWPGYAFLRLARQQGHLADAPVELLEEGSMSDSLAALEAGTVDGAALTLDNVIYLRSRGVDLVVVLLFNVSSGGDALLAPPSLSSLADLRGARVGAEDSALSAVMLNCALRAAGLERDAIEVVHFTGNALSAWKAGGLDAILAYQPSVQALRREGLQVIFDSRQTPFLIVDVLAVRRDALPAMASGLRTLIRAHFAVQQRWREDPLNTNFALASLLGVDVQHVHEVFRGLNIPDVRYNRQYLTAPALELAEAARTLCDIMREEGVCAGPSPSFDGLFLPDYLPERP